VIAVLSTCQRHCFILPVSDKIMVDDTSNSAQFISVCTRKVNAREIERTGGILKERWENLESEAKVSQAIVTTPEILSVGD